MEQILVVQQYEDVFLIVFLALVLIHNSFDLMDVETMVVIQNGGEYRFHKQVLLEKNV
jgi:hypothetical protein